MNKKQFKKIRQLKKFAENIRRYNEYKKTHSGKVGEGLRKGFQFIQRPSRFLYRKQIVPLSNEQREQMLVSIAIQNRIRAVRQAEQQRNFNNKVNETMMYDYCFNQPERTATLLDSEVMGVRSNNSLIDSTITDLNNQVSMTGLLQDQNHLRNIDDEVLIHSRYSLNHNVLEPMNQAFMMAYAVG